MGKLIYPALASAYGYVEDAAGNFDWAAPDEEVHRFANDLGRPVGTCLYGRRMYETVHGKRALPDEVRSDLELLNTHRFASGAVYLRYRPKPYEASEE